jgi:hypothetical protein
MGIVRTQAPARGLPASSPTEHAQVRREYFLKGVLAQFLLERSDSPIHLG